MATVTVYFMYEGLGAYHRREQSSADFEIDETLWFEYQSALERLEAIALRIDVEGTPISEWANDVRRDDDMRKAREDSKI